MKVAVFGGGSWGTTLANMLARNGVRTTLWMREQELLAEVVARRENTWYLPGIALADSLECTNDMAGAVEGADIVLMTIPCQFYRSGLNELREHLPKKPVIVCANKGIEIERLCTMSEVTEQALGSLKPRFAMLSGPSFAREVSQEKPTAVALGCADRKLGRDIQQALSTDYFRIYTTTDHRGVELGGAIKNIIAIAAGISDGLEFGHDARAALITRGLAEMGRLGRALGAKPETFNGLSGMGDLVLTCTGDLSRNRQVGLRLGRGKKLMDILAEMKMVAEGVKTTEAVHGLGEKHGVELPITGEVYKVLYEDKDPRQSVIDLMTRDLKDEA